MGLGLYGKALVAIDGTKLEVYASKRKHYSRNKLTKMKDIAESKIKEYLHELEILDELDNEYEVNCFLIESNINELNEKIDKYLELEKTMDESGENEINLTDSGARTVKFGAHQGADVGYNVQTVVDEKIS